MVALSKLLVAGALVATCTFSVSGVAANASSKMDSRSFMKLLELSKKAGSDQAVVAHFKKLYSYDSKDITDHVTLNTAETPGVVVTDVEIDADKLDKPEEMEEKPDGSDWEKKDVKKRQGDKALIDALGLDTSTFPAVHVFKGGESVASLPVKEDSTSVEDVQQFLLTKAGIRVVNTDAIPELEPTLLKFLSSPTEDGIDEMDKEIRKLGELSAARELLTESILRVMKTVLTKKSSGKLEDGGEKYVEKELARVQGMLSSAAITEAKKKDMGMKVKALSMMNGAVAASRAASEKKEL